jgi:hypothetical protein
MSRTAHAVSKTNGGSFEASFFAGTDAGLTTNQAFHYSVKVVLKTLFTG